VSTVHRRLLRVGAVAGLAACLILAPTLLAAQSPAERSLARATAAVAEHWASGNVSGLASFAPRDGRVTVELDAASGAVQWRHASAALRSLFGDRETVSVQVEDAAVTEGDPGWGFGQLSWTSRVRGTREAQRHTVFIGFSWEGGAWRIREIRLLG
jgi:hypothetical protein